MDNNKLLQIIEDEYKRHGDFNIDTWWNECYCDFCEEARDVLEIDLED